MDKYKKEGYKWYHFGQNNSGGRFIINEDLAEDVLIQGKDVNSVLYKAHELMDASNANSCECCGDRWDFYIDAADAKDFPTMYDIPITEMEPSHYRTSARLHYADGTIEAYQFKKKSLVEPLPLPG